MVGAIFFQLHMTFVSSVRSTYNVQLPQLFYYTLSLNLFLILAFTRHLKIDLCRILTQLRPAVILRSLFASSTIVSYLASNQFLAPSYSQFLLLCGNLLLPCIARSDLNETSTVMDQLIIVLGLLGSLMFLTPLNSLP